MKQANYSEWIGRIAIVATRVRVIPGQLIAAVADIILTRQVQPRAAVRLPLIADPDPWVVNPKPSSYVGETLHMRCVPAELRGRQP